MRNAVMLLLALVATPAAADLRIVGAGEQYQTIQAAIDSARDGDCILVRPGIYAEAVLIEGTSTDPITLQLVAEHGPDSTTIAGPGTGVLVRWGEDVEICGFTLRDNNPYGIQIRHSTGVRIRENVIHDNASSGIDIPGSLPPTDASGTWALIEDNTVVRNAYGILFDGGARVEIRRNLVIGNSSTDVGLCSNPALATLDCNVFNHGGCTADAGAGTSIFVNYAGDNFHLSASLLCDGVPVGASFDGCGASCAPSTVSLCGSVVGCDGGLPGVMLTLTHPDLPMEYFQTSTDANGNYCFENLPRSSQEARVEVIVPLGFESLSPTDGVRWVPLDLAQAAVSFELACLSPIGEPCSKGYWGHQVTVYAKNRGHAQETEHDMEQVYPAAVFNHFYENVLNSIQAEGVTFMDASNPRPLTLGEMMDTLVLQRNVSMLQRAKQQYLALLLNLASGRLLTTSVISADGGTASQAVQQIATYLNDGDATNDELAKDIADVINNAQLVMPGVVDLTSDTILYKGEAAPQAYRTGHGPNPFNPRLTIFLSSPTEESFTVHIFDVAGRLIRRLDGTVFPGQSSVVWDGRNGRGAEMASGVYYYVARVGPHTGRASVLMAK